MLSNGYILILIWVGVIAALAVMAPEWVYRTELVNGEKVRRVTPLFAVVAVLPLVIWAGFRGYVGIRERIFRPIEKCQLQFPV